MARQTRAEKAETREAGDELALAPYSTANYLDSEETIASYLDVVAKRSDGALMVRALGEVAKARGMGRVAKESGLGRESLYKALKPGAEPRFSTVLAVMRAMNLGLSITTASGPVTGKVRRLKAKPGALGFDSAASGTPRKTVPRKSSKTA